jgi:hypothetical protein
MQCTDAQKAPIPSICTIPRRRGKTKQNKEELSRRRHRLCSWLVMHCNAALRGGHNGRTASPTPRRRSTSSKLPGYRGHWGGWSHLGAQAAAGAVTAQPLLERSAHGQLDTASSAAGPSSGDNGSALILQNDVPRSGRSAFIHGRNG